MAELFLELPAERRAIAMTVLRTAQSECEPERCPVEPLLAASVSESVARYADARITSHLPVLALKRVRCCIQTGTCDCGC